MVEVKLVTRTYEGITFSWQDNGDNRVDLNNPEERQSLKITINGAPVSEQTVLANLRFAQLIDRDMNAISSADFDSEGQITEDEMKRAAEIIARYAAARGISLTEALKRYNPRNATGEEVYVIYHNANLAVMEEAVRQDETALRNNPLLAQLNAAKTAAERANILNRLFPTRSQALNTFIADRNTPDWWKTATAEQIARLYIDALEGVRRNEEISAGVTYRSQLATVTPFPTEVPYDLGNINAWYRGEKISTPDADSFGGGSLNSFERAMRHGDHKRALQIAKRLKGNARNNALLQLVDAFTGEHDLARATEAMHAMTNDDRNTAILKLVVYCLKSDEQTTYTRAAEFIALLEDTTNLGSRLNREELDALRALGIEIEDQQITPKTIKGLITFAASIPLEVRNLERQFVQDYQRRPGEEMTNVIYELREGQDLSAARTAAERLLKIANASTDKKVKAYALQARAKILLAIARATNPTSAIEEVFLAAQRAYNQAFYALVAADPESRDSIIQKLRREAVHEMCSAVAHFYDNEKKVKNAKLVKKLAEMIPAGEQVKLFIGKTDWPNQDNRGDSGAFVKRFGKGAKPATAAGGAPTVPRGRGRHQPPPPAGPEAPPPAPGG